MMIYDITVLQMSDRILMAIRKIPILDSHWEPIPPRFIIRRFITRQFIGLEDWALERQYRNAR